MKKKIAALFLLCLMYFSICFGYTGVNNFTPKYGTLNSNSNLRIGPATSFTSLKVLPVGTAVKIVGEINDFYIVQTPTNQVGMIAKSLIANSDKAPAGAATYTNLASRIVTITDSVINVRSGPSIVFSVVTKVYKGQNVKIIGEINDFYMVVTADNKVGMIRKDLLGEAGNEGDGSSNVNMSEDEKYVLELINQERRNNNIPELAMDGKLLEVARLKANDMVTNNYFAHNSPTYGSPFDMMKKYGITYRAAGENIAGNPSLKNAVASWMNSPSHKDNILSNNYNYAGIGVVPSERYGYVIVAMFIGK